MNVLHQCTCTRGYRSYIPPASRACTLRRTAAHVLPTATLEQVLTARYYRRCM